MHHVTWGLKSRRSPVFSTKGMCSSSQPLATQIGIKILNQGGNCVDAAVAIAAALNVTEPCSTGIGGDCFALYYNTRDKCVYGLNGSGRAPRALSLDRARADLGLPSSAEQDQVPLGTLPHGHIHTVTVPGAAAGWVDAIKTWGKLTLAECLQPAIELAENGYPVGPIASHSWHEHIHQLHGSANGHEMMVPDARTEAHPLAAEANANAGAPAGKHAFAASLPADTASSKFAGFHTPQVGEFFRNPNLANTFRRVAEHGHAGFYEGQTAEAIVELVQSLGGVLDLEDLKSHQSEFVDPIHVNYRGVDVYEIPPNGQGITALLALNILQEIQPPLSEHAPFGSAQHYHRLIQCMRLAFADTRWYVADPQYNQVPVAELLSKEYAQRRAALFTADPDHAFRVEKGEPTSSSDTVSFCVVDSEGNSCSFIISNYMGFGSGFVPRGCGFTLQNRGCGFSLQASHPNVLAGCKRPYHTIIPGMAVKDGRLWAPFSVMGGFMQPQGHVQVLTHMIDFGLDPQSAIDAPRFCIADGTANGAVLLEDGIDPAVVEELKRMGHPLTFPVSGFARSWFGKSQIIRALPNGALWAGSDGRGDGAAMPQV